MNVFLFKLLYSENTLDIKVDELYNTFELLMGGYNDGIRIFFIKMLIPLLKNIPGASDILYLC